MIIFLEIVRIIQSTYLRYELVQRKGMVDRSMKRFLKTRLYHYANSNTNYICERHELKASQIKSHSIRLARSP